MYNGPLDEDATHVLPTESRDVEKGIAVVDGMAILHKMQYTALGTVVDLSHGFLVSERSQLSKNVFGYNSPQNSSENI